MRSLPAVAVVAVILAGCGTAASQVTPAATSTSASTVASTAPPGTASAGTAVAPPGSVVTVPAFSPPPTGTVPVQLTEPPATAPPHPPAGSGVFGFVTAGPTCPVERSGQPCPPRPVGGRVEAEAGGAVAGSADIGADGSYRLSLQPGAYTLVVQTGSTLPACPRTQVTVPAGQSVRADISCDTGIR